MKHPMWTAAAVLGSSIGVCVAYAPPVAAQPPAAPTTRSQVTVFRVRPDMVDQFLDFQVQRVIPALKKAGVPQRTVYQSVLGEMFEFRSVVPAPKFADREATWSPIEKALGPDGAKDFNAALRKLIVSQRVFMINSVASYDPTPDRIFKVMVLSTVHVTPGREPEYLGYVQNELLPIQKRANTSRYLVSQEGLGGDVDAYHTAVFLERVGDLDAGSAASRVLGAEGAAKLRQKLAGIATASEVNLYTRVDALSYRMRAGTR